MLRTTLAFAAMVVLIPLRTFAAGPCDVASSDPIAGEPRQSARWTAVGDAPTLVRFPIAGPSLLVRLRFPGGRSTADGVNVRLFAKREWDSPFELVCSASVTSSSAVTGRAAAPGHLQWKVEVEWATWPSSGPAPLDVAAFDTVPPKEPIPAELARNQDSLALNVMVGAQSELVCQKDRRVRYQDGVARSHPFSNQPVLRVGLEDPANMLGQEGRELIGLYTAKAVATWNAVCANCAGNLRLLSIGDERYLNSVYGSALRQGFPLDAFELMILGLERNSSKNGSTYVRLASDDAAARQLCSADPRRLEPPLDVIQGELGCRPPRTERQPDVTLRLLDGPPPGCANLGTPSDEIVACRVGNVIELNGRDFTFTAHEEGRPLFGRGRRRSDLLAVLTHEAGHWVGLDHVADGSIMADTISPDSCINDVTVSRFIAVQDPPAQDRPLALRAR